MLSRKGHERGGKGHAVKGGRQAGGGSEGRSDPHPNGSLDVPLELGGGGVGLQHSQGCLHLAAGLHGAALRPLLQHHGRRITLGLRHCQGHILHLLPLRSASLLAGICGQHIHSMTADSSACLICQTF